MMFNEVTVTGRLVRDDDLIERALEHGRLHRPVPVQIDIDYATLERRILEECHDEVRERRDG